MTSLSLLFWIVSGIVLQLAIFLECHRSADEHDIWGRGGEGRSKDEGEQGAKGRVATIDYGTFLMAGLLRRMAQQQDLKGSLW